MLHVSSSELERDGGRGDGKRSVRNRRGALSSVDPTETKTNRQNLAVNSGIE